MISTDSKLGFDSAPAAVMQLTTEKDAEYEKDADIERPLQKAGSLNSGLQQNKKYTTKELVKMKVGSKELMDMKYTEHLVPLEYIAVKYKTHFDISDPAKSKGLSSEAAAALLKQNGPNILTPPPTVPGWKKFLLQFTDLLIVLLEMVCIVCLILFGISFGPNTNFLFLWIAILLFILIVFTCYETYAAESKADNLMAQFKKMIPAAASVLRDGDLKTIPASEIVIGDIIRMKSGDKVPADCRVFFNQSMKVDQSMITGESEAIDVQVNAQHLNPNEATNIIFNGSLVVDGNCYGVAIRTGDDTLIGSVVEMTGDTGKNSSTLKADIKHFVVILFWFSLCQSAVVFAVSLSNKVDPLFVFINGFIVIMIANVPQGLPSTITACLLIIADRMGKKNVFVKKLDIVETLGSCSLICTDKTGTLTENRMTVENTWYFSTTLQNNEFAAKHTAEASLGKRTQAQILMEVATLNSRIVMERENAEDDNSPFKPVGDATELGLYKFLTTCVKNRTGMEIEDYRQANKKVFEVPFNSSNKWQMSIHNMQSLDGKQLLLLKGAPDVLLSKCSHYVAEDGSYQKIDQKFDEIYTVAYEHFGGEGQRVLGFAMRPMKRSIEEEEMTDPKFKEKLKASLVAKPENSADAAKDLIFAGLVTLMDPPRSEVPQAVRECQSAGVRVVMVTGDHPLTAAAIARKIGLITTKTREDLAKERGIPKDQVPEQDIEAVVVHGASIPAMTDADWDVLISKKDIVFARTSPEQKLIIVNRFTSAGNVTAMTGDGVNDSPALKQAAIGIAMGLNGSEVAREAADLVLLDDNFASIVVGIKEGRLLFANLKKSVAYTLCHLVPEVMPVLLWSFVGCPQAMGSLLALCIDLLTELLPATSLAYEEPEGDIMMVPPRNPKTDKLTSFALLFYAYAQTGMIETGGCLFTYFRTFAKYGISPQELYEKMKNQYFPALDGTSNWVVSPDSARRYNVPEGTLYTPHEQNQIMMEVMCAWFLMIVAGQAWHIWNARKARESIFSHGFRGLISNKYVNIAVPVAVALGCIVAYVPGINEITQASRHPESLDIFFASLFTGFCFISHGELRKFLCRKFPQSWFVKKFVDW
jgi:sodium/potassium uptake antiporter P-type ATPase alpha subunit